MPNFLRRLDLRFCAEDGLLLRVYALWYSRQHRLHQAWPLLKHPGLINSLHLEHVLKAEVSEKVVSWLVLLTLPPCRLELHACGSCGLYAMPPTGLLDLARDRFKEGVDPPGTGIPFLLIAAPQDKPIRKFLALGQHILPNP